MRLGHFVSFGIGGADQAAFRLVEAQQLAGLSPVVFGSEASRPASERITSDQDPTGNVLSIEDAYARIGVPVKIVRTNAEIRSHKLDILHTHRSGEDTFLLKGLGEPGSARVVVETNFHGFLKTPADVRVFPSEELLTFRRIKLSPNFFVIANPVMNKLTSSDRRGEWGVEGKVVLGRLSRSDRSAYSPKLLLVYKLLKLQGYDLRLVWAGASSMARRDAEKLKIDDIVWVPTSSDATEVSSWHNSFDIFCHVPRLGETFGNTVAEAMMHGKPVLSWRGARSYPQAQREVLGDRNQMAAGMIEFRRKLQNFIDVPETRAVVGSKNHTRAKEEFSAQAVAEKYFAVYEKHLGL